jgi:hypothetical protein
VWRQNLKLKSVVFFPPPSLYHKLARLTDAVVLGSSYVQDHPRCTDGSGG